MAITINKSKELQWVKEGRVYMAQHGLLTTPAAFETDLVRQTPDLLVIVAAGVVIVPMRVQVVAEATDTAVFQCLVSSSNNSPGVANMTANTPVNCNTRYATTGSAVTAYITNTGATGTAPTGVHDYLRVYVEPRIDNVGTGSALFDHVVYSPLHGKGVPAIVGDDSNVTAFYVYVGAAGAATGYIMAQWAEFTYTEFYAV